LETARIAINSFPLAPAEDIDPGRRAAVPLPRSPVYAAGVIGPVVDMAWWLEHRSTVVTADVRWYLDGRSGSDAYARGHLPGAVFVDLDRWLAGPASAAAGRHPLPDPAVFAQGIGALGIGDEDTVVAYDDAGGVTAARLVWMLRATGRAAALLDGGLAAYRATLEVGVPAAAAQSASFTTVPWPAERLAGPAALGGAILLDAREGERFRGEVEPVDPRPGHIPGARSLPCREHVDTDGRLLDDGTLRARLAAVGVAGPADAVISSCGSGVTACHTLLLLEHLGLGQGRLYPGSYSQWSNDPARPVATGAG
jgi:thiosulfate/3-mercaptopyruvate sulfurtransferase